MACAIIDCNDPRFNGLFGRHMVLTTRGGTCIYGDPSRTSVTPLSNKLAAIRSQSLLGDHALKCDIPGRLEAVLGRDKAILAHHSLSASMSLRDNPYSLTASSNTRTTSECPPRAGQYRQLVPSLRLSMSSSLPPCLSSNCDDM